jgi:cbb3-type cytochrome oxidase subunit 3
MAAALGFLTGVFVATIYHLSHDHSAYSPDALIEHFVPQFIRAATACALLLAFAAVILNRLRRNR